jgi:hypothetical protein
MKKILYSVLVAFSLCISLSACTEEEVSPTREPSGNGGGTGITEKL